MGKARICSWKEWQKSEIRATRFFERTLCRRSVAAEFVPRPGWKMQGDRLQCPWSSLRFVGDKIMWLLKVDAFMHVLYYYTLKQVSSTAFAVVSGCFGSPVTLMSLVCSRQLLTWKHEQGPKLSTPKNSMASPSFSHISSYWYCFVYMFCVYKLVCVCVKIVQKCVYIFIYTYNAPKLSWTIQTWQA